MSAQTIAPVAPAPVRIGCSGWIYPHWRGLFYPRDLPVKRWFAFYASEFDTVEVNNTFYRLPTPRAVEGWARGAPPGFIYALKASQWITHRKRLRDVEREVRVFWDATTPLGEKRGPVLFGLPPNLRSDLGLLEAFLAVLPPDCRAALEPRHPSWFEDAVYGALRKRDVALCITDAEAGDVTTFVPTASWGYVRLRRERYSERALAAWATRLRAAVPSPWREAFVYVKHDEVGRAPRYASRLNALLAAARAPRKAPAGSRRAAAPRRPPR